MRCNPIPGVVLCALSCLLAPLAAAQDSAQVAGVWYLTVRNPQVVHERLDFEQDGDRIRGSVKAADFEAPLRGALLGNQVSFTIMRQTPSGVLALNFTGTVSGNQISGTANIAGNEREWSAWRSQVPASSRAARNDVATRQESFSFTEGYYQPSTTSDPTFPSWSPDGRQLAFALDGSLWTVSAQGGEATQVTAGASYDSEPQWSPDGRSILYTAEMGRANELFVLDLASHKTRQLTHFGRVTLDPRWSPDGQLIAFASGSTGSWGGGGNYFNLYVMLADGSEPPVALTRVPELQPGQTSFPGAENIEPTFTGDGRAILFLSRRAPPDGRPVVGSGWIWRVPVTGGEPKLVQAEETAYQTRPTVSPDGSRVAYVSLRRGQYALSVIPIGGGEPLPVTRRNWQGNDWAEEFEPAWSPDTSQIAFIDNSDHGRLGMWVVSAKGGVPRRVAITGRRYASPVGQVKIAITNPDGDRAARLYLVASDGKSYFPADVYHRLQSSTRDHYTHAEGEVTVTLPAGPATIEATKGFEYAPAKTTVEVRANQTTTATLTLRRIANLPAAGWWSGDNHVHGNYGGLLHITPEDLALMERAEDLNVLNDLICNRDNRIFDLDRFEGRPNSVSRAGRIVYYSEEYRPALYGHMGMLGLGAPVFPFYNGERGTGYAANFPTNADGLDMMHANGGVGGAWHLFNYAEDPSDRIFAGAREVPVDVALGKTDFVEILSGWSNYDINTAIWYRLLNAGFHLAISSGTDSFPNFHRINAVGNVRVYVHSGPQLDYRGWLKALVAGRSFVTSGPLLQFTVEGHEPGDTVQLPGSGESRVTLRAKADSIYPMKTLSIIRNGRVVEKVDLSGAQAQHVDLTRTLDVPESGWLALRVDGDPNPHHLLMHSTLFAHTAAVYLNRGSQPTRSLESARYFLEWIDNSMAILEDDQNWDSDAEKEHAVDVYRRARKVYEQMLADAPPSPAAASR